MAFEIHWLQIWVVSILNFKSFFGKSNKEALSQKCSTWIKGQFNTIWKEKSNLHVFFGVFEKQDFLCKTFFLEHAKVEHPFHIRLDFYSFSMKKIKTAFFSFSQWSYLYCISLNLLISLPLPSNFLYLFLLLHVLCPFWMILHGHFWENKVNITGFLKGDPLNV